MNSELLILTIIAAAIGSFLGSYFKEKGKNLATKEDIGEITKTVESIKTENANQLELFRQENRMSLQQLDQTHQLSRAALDQRLAAHQEAYALWWNLMGCVHDENKVYDMVVKCQDWWANHNLYLSEKSRDAFTRAYSAAHSHKDIVRAWQRGGDRDEDNKRVLDNWDVIERAGRIITEEVKLPSFIDVKYNPFTGKKTEAM